MTEGPDTKKHMHPPRISAFILGRLLSDHFDTSVGDFEEGFNEVASAYGPRRARWWYRGQVLRLIPDQIFEELRWGIIMLRNYFTVGLRTMQRNPVASSINIFGLSAAIGSAIALFFFILVLNTNDDFHANGAEIYMVGHTAVREVDESGQPDRWGSSPAPLGPALVSGFPQVQRAVRVSRQRATVQTGESAFQENFTFADPGFFEMFTFPLAAGLPDALLDPQSVVLSSEMATKYFRDQDPVGEGLLVRFGDGAEELLVVRGVAAAFPESASFRFDFLLGYDKLGAVGTENMDDWGVLTSTTFVQIPDPDDVEFVTDEMASFLGPINAADDAKKVSALFLDNVQNPDWRTAWLIRGRAMQAPRVAESVMFGVLGILMLLVSCFNYVTIALGSAAQRLKEIGIRKTVGAEKSQLIGQFLTENLVICCVALLGGILVAATVTIPFLNSMVALDIPMDYFGELQFWVFLIGILAFVGIASGAYPAFYISAFMPMEILRGKRTIAEKKGLTRTLTTLQFVLTILTISFSAFIGSLDEKLTPDDWGYDKESLVILPVLGEEHFDLLKNEASLFPNVVALSGTRDHLGAFRSRTWASAEATDRRVYYFGVSPDYLETMGIQTREGRSFGGGFESDDATSVVINKTFASELASENPVGESIRMDAQLYTVVGVVEDFLIAPLLGKEHPVVFEVSPPSQFRSLAVRVAQGQEEQTVASLRDLWERKFPEASFSYYPQQEVFESQSLQGLSTFTAYLAGFALLISCMGLFGLASQKAAQRVKEVGIRKAMGASAAHIVVVVNRDFLVMLGIATLIATSLGVMAGSFFLDLAQFDVSVGAAPFVISNLLVFLVAALSLAVQSRKLVQVVPADVLRVD
ncbi:MAG: putative ABC transport system permease protein [Rhodothermales bacterium]|jgi:putative ABC transport system permease protein